MIKRLITTTLIISLLLTFTPLLPSFAGEETVKMEVLSGPVQYKTEAYGNWLNASGSIEIYPGYYINTGPEGSALFHFSDGSKIRLYENSMLKLNEVRSLGETRNYTVRFLGKILARPEQNSQKTSYFFNNAPTADISSGGKEFIAEVASDLFVQVNVLEGSAKASDAFSIDGKVKEIFPEQNIFILEAEDGQLLTVRIYPHTIFYRNYALYRETGNPGDLGNLSEDLKMGEEVIVFGELIDEAAKLNFEGKILIASLITKRAFLPAALWNVSGVKAGGTALFTAGAIGAIGAAVIILTDEEQPVSPINP